MHFGFDEQQEMLRSTAISFLNKECTESLVREMELSSTGHSLELWGKMAELGWLGIPFPEKYGGGEGSMLDLVVLFEEMGRFMCPVPYLSTVVLCGLAILRAGNERQKSEFLKKISEGNLILALALTERDVTIDPSGIEVRATQDKDEFIIDGTKIFVHDACVADYILCVVRTTAATSFSDGISLFLVERSSPGLRCEQLRTVSGDKQCEITFDKVSVPKENLVGELHGGWPAIAKVIQIGAVLLCGQMIGAGQRMLEMSVEHAKTRVQFDQYIGVNQHVQEHCIDIFTRVNGSRNVTYKAAWKLNEGLPCDVEVAIAKAWTSDAHELVCRSAHSIFGGSGYTYDSTLPLISRRGKVAQLYLGDSAYYRKKIAESMRTWTLEMPKGQPLGIWDNNLIELV